MRKFSHLSSVLAEIRHDWRTGAVVDLEGVKSSEAEASVRTHFAPH